MANKPLQSIKFPGLADTYIVPQIDDTLTQTGQAADAGAVRDVITRATDYKETKASSPSTDWEQGLFQVSNGSKSTSTTRLRTKTDAGVGKDVVYASCETGYQALMFCWNNGTYLGVFENNAFFKENVSWATSWNLEDARKLGATTIKFQLRKTNNAVLSASDGENLKYTSASIGIKGTLDLIGGHLVRGYKDKKISILGDSISTYGGSVSDPTNERYSQEGNPYTYVGNRCRYPQTSLGVTSPDQTYWMQLINALGLQLGINDSWASTRVSWDGTTESTDIGADKYIASQTRINHLGENGTPDYILVNAGTNDIINNVAIGTIDDTDPSTISDFSTLPVATFADAYRTLLARIMHTYPNAKIICLLPNFAAGYGSKKQDNYCEIIKDLCDMYGVACLDMRVNGITPFNKQTYLGDGLHYNDSGMALVADELIRQFMTLI